MMDMAANPSVAGPRTPLTTAASLAAITVLVAEPARSTRKPLAAGLRRMGIGRVLQAGTVADLDAILANRIPGNLALINLVFHPQRELLTRTLLDAGWARVIVLTPTTDPGPILAAVRAGASGVLRTRPDANLPDVVYDLSYREIQIIQYVADGRSNKWIARELALSPLTVKSQLARTGRKLGISERAVMIAAAMRAGLIT